MISRIWQRYGYSIRWTVSIGLLLMVVSKVDVHMLSSLFARIDWWYYPIGGLLVLLAVVFASMRWHLYEPRLGLSTLLRVNIISSYYAFLSGTALLADVIKLAHIDNYNHPKHELVGSMIVEKVLAFMGGSLTLLLGVLLADRALREGLLLFSVIFATLCAGIVLLGSSRSVKRIIEMLHRVVPARCHSTMTRRDSVVRTLTLVSELLSSKSRLAAAMSYTLISNLTIAVVYWLWSIVFDIHLAAGSYIVISVWAQFATMVPLSVAGLGVRDVTTTALLVSVGTPQSTAVIASLSFYPLVLLVSTTGFILTIIPQKRGKDESNGIA